MIEDQRSGDQHHKSYGAPPATPLSRKNPSESDQDRTKSNHDSWREWARFGIEVLAFLFLIRYVHWTKVQSLATEAAANAAKQSADAADASISDVRVRAKSELRAYINLGNVTYSGVSDDNKLKFTVNMVNGGRTPARRFTLQTQVAILSPDENLFLPGLSFKDRCPSTRDKVGVSSAVVPPIFNNPFTQIAESAVLNPDQLVVAKANKKLDNVVFMHGCAVYVDIFGKSRTTEFCAEWDGLNLRLCDRYNDSN